MLKILKPQENNDLEFKIIIDLLKIMLSIIEYKQKMFLIISRTIKVKCSFLLWQTNLIPAIIEFLCL